MKKTLIFVFLIIIAIFISKCGTKNTKIDEFNLTLDLPMGWKINKDNFKGKITIEISNAGRRVMNITEANPSIENLDMLVKATNSVKSYKVLNQESFAGGFGVTIQTRTKKQFRYYVQKDNKQIRFEPAAYYKDLDFNRCIEIIKSAK